MDEKKRSDAHQPDCVTQEPTYRAMIGDQGNDAKKRCSCCRSRTQNNVADHILAATQPQIDLHLPA